MAGAKRGKHTSVYKEMQRTVRWLEKLPAIRKILLGRFICCRKPEAPGTLKVRYTDVARKMVVVRGYADDGLMDISLLLCDAADIESVVQKIEKH